MRRLYHLWSSFESRQFLDSRSHSTCCEKVHCSEWECPLSSYRTIPKGWLGLERSIVPWWERFWGKRLIESIQILTEGCCWLRVSLMMNLKVHRMKLKAPSYMKQAILMIKRWLLQQKLVFGNASTFHQSFAFLSERQQLDIPENAKPGLTQLTWWQFIRDISWEFFLILERNWSSQATNLIAFAKAVPPWEIQNSFHLSGIKNTWISYFLQAIQRERLTGGLLESEIIYCPRSALTERHEVTRMTVKWCNILSDSRKYKRTEISRIYTLHRSLKVKIQGTWTHWTDLLTSGNSTCFHLLYW